MSFKLGLLICMMCLAVTDLICQTAGPLDIETWTTGHVAEPSNVTCNTPELVEGFRWSIQNQGVTQKNPLSSRFNLSY